MKATAKNMAGFYSLTEQTIGAYKKATDGKRNLYDAMVHYFEDQQKDKISFSFKVLEGEIVVYSEINKNEKESKAYWKKEDGKYYLLNYDFSLKDKIETVTEKLESLDPIKD